MILLRDVRGQKNAVKFLLRNLSSGRVSNSYLFSGPNGVGRATSAKAFIAQLFCGNKDFEGNPCLSCPVCRKLDKNEHPDMNWIAPEKKKTIKIEQIRGVKDFLNLKPYESGRSICVIEDAHMMTREASNALLKVLEEPPGKAIIILISDKKELLLDTVISRCSEVRFSSLSGALTSEIIRKSVEIDDRTASFLSCFSQGSPGRAIEMLDDGFFERKEEMMKLVQTIIRDEKPSLMNWDHSSKEALFDDIDMLILFFRDIAIEKSGASELIIDDSLRDGAIPAIFNDISIEKIYLTVECLLDMKKVLERNVSAKLVAQALPGRIA